MALSAVLATEFTSLAAPRTVLQAAAARAAPIRATVIIFLNICFLLVTAKTNAALREGVHSGCGIVAAVIGEMPSDRDGCSDVGVRIVVFEDEIVGFVVEKALSAVFDHQTREGSRLAS
jgi:hypothetical protein